MNCENVCKVVSAIGTLGIGVGTFMLGYAACSKLPESANIIYDAAIIDRQNIDRDLASKINRNVRMLAPDNNLSLEDKEKALSEIKILEPEFKAIFRDTDILDKLQDAYQTLKERPAAENKLIINESIEAVGKLTEPIFRAVPQIENLYRKERPISDMPTLDGK